VLLIAKALAGPLAVYLLGSVLLAGVARADGPDAAATMFDRGLADMQAQRYATACPEIAESYRLDPHAGGLFTLAECESLWGKIASAVTDYDNFLDLVAHLPPHDRPKQEARAKIAAEKRAALSREVPSVTVSLDAGIPVGSTVKIDGRAVSSAKLDSSIPLDPGDHVITVEAPDGRTNEQRVSLARRDARAVALVLPALSVAPGQSERPAVTSDSGGARSTVMWVTGGVGAAAVVAGVVMGAIVVAEKSSIDSNCPTATTCATTADANSANGARTLGWASTGILIGGGAAIGAAVVLWLARPAASSSSIEPVVAPSTNGAILGLKGAF
jgi:hypothetical protein